MIATVQNVSKWESGVVLSFDDELAEEEPLEIRVRGRALSVTMRTPGHDPELAAGFLLGEGIVQKSKDILKIDPCERNEFGNLINVQLAPEVFVDFEKLTRHVFASSSCGLCGKATIESIHKRCGRIETVRSKAISASMLATLPDLMRRDQATFDRTGGLHAAAMFNLDGTLVALREDVGRHNAVDKLLGHCLLNGMLPLENNVLLLSGRTSFELVQKALTGRIPIIASVSAPSSLAVEFSRENNQTLIGFLRPGRMNVYTHPERVAFT